MNHCHKDDIISLDIFSVHPKLSHSYEEIGTKGLVKATVQSFLSNTNIGTVTKRKPVRKLKMSLFILKIEKINFP